MNIEPSEQYGGGLNQRLSSDITPELITETLGLPPVPPCDAGKTAMEWRFLADGEPCGIWDYHGTRWSTAGPRAVFEELFGAGKVYS